MSNEAYFCSDHHPGTVAIPGSELIPGRPGQIVTELNNLPGGAQDLVDVRVWTKRQLERLPQSIRIRNSF